MNRKRYGIIALLIILIILINIILVVVSNKKTIAPGSDTIEKPASFAIVPNPATEITVSNNEVKQYNNLTFTIANPQNLQDKGPSFTLWINYTVDPSKSITSVVSGGDKIEVGVYTITVASIDSNSVKLEIVSQ